MELVNSLTAFQWWPNYLDVGGVAMRGVLEKQGFAFSRHGWLASTEDPTIDPDRYGAMLRRSLRPLSAATLAKARDEYAQREVVRFPRYFIVEPNASCNRKCVFCPIIVTNRHGRLSYETFEKLMHECGQHDVYGISLYQLNEPFLWRDPVMITDIADLVECAKRIGGFRAVNLSTNGDVNNLDCVLRPGVNLDDLFISIDGTTAEVYDQNRPSTRPNDVGTFERTVNRVMAFLAQKAKVGESRPWVRLQIINNALCAPQVLDFIRFWIAVPGVDDVFVKNLDGMNPWLGNAAVSAEESALKLAQVRAMPCQHIYAIGSMVADSRFNACCHDALTELTTAGANINEMSFADWWNGDYMNDLRREHQGGVTRRPCMECAERDPWLGGM